MNHTCIQSEQSRFKTLYHNWEPFRCIKGGTFVSMCSKRHCCLLGTWHEQNNDEFHGKETQSNIWKTARFSKHILCCFLQQKENWTGDQRSLCRAFSHSCTVIKMGGGSWIKIATSRPFWFCQTGFSFHCWSKAATSLKIHVPTFFQSSSTLLFLKFEMAPGMQHTYKEKAIHDS